MKQSLDLKLGQHLTITPQLQQAIRLLQLSTLELQQEVQQALESNPLLEEAEEELAPDEAREAAADTDYAETDAEGGETPEEDEVAVAADAEVDHGVNDEDARAEEEWNESAADYTAPTTRTSGEDLPDIDTRNSAPTTLRDHLLWQMQMMVFSDTDRRIAIALIDAIDDDGYLDASLEDVQQAVGGEPPVDLDEIEAVLHQIQNFDPAGVGARSLAECLLLQLRQLPDSDPVRTHAKLIATPENLDLLAARDFKSLKRNTKLSTEDLQSAIHLIQHLNPRPGAGIQSGHAAYVVPDITVRKLRGVWRAELNSHVTPRVRINQEYERLIRRGSDSADNRYLQEKLQEARWFLKSLTSRNETLLKVSRAIVDRQRGFFEHGPEAMRPLVLHDIAEIVGMHESTISRVTTNKYMLTPRGIFELKYFFSSHVGTADGGTCSATAIRSLIRKLIEAEKTDKPISDSMIAEILDKQGIHVARRTVAKYRESLNIPPSSQRKSLT